MNIRKNSLFMLGLVLGVSVILYIFDVRKISLLPQIIPSATPTALPQKPTEAPQEQVFSETGPYMVKRFNQSIVVSVTLKNTIVTKLTIEHSQATGESTSYLEAFDKEIHSLVVGKSIKDINVSHVAGASYTTEGFMRAIDKIRTQTL